MEHSERPRGVLKLKRKASAEAEELTHLLSEDACGRGFHSLVRVKKNGISTARGWTQQFFLKEDSGVHRQHEQFTAI